MGKSTETPPPFIQIAAGRKYNLGLFLFGLDECGNVWRREIGSDYWVLMTGAPHTDRLRP